MFLDAGPKPFPLRPFTMDAMDHVSKPDAQDDAGLWQSCLERLALEVPPQQFGAWIKPLQVQCTGSRVQLQVPNRIALNHIRQRFLGRIGALLHEITGQEVQLELSLGARASAPRGPGKVAARGVQSQPVQDWVAQAQGELVRHEPAGLQESHQAQADAWADVRPDAPAVVSAADEAQRFDSHLDPQLNFDNLIEGAANRVARAAALSAAHEPGERKHNPLFIYGGAGLGKTHLMHALGNQMVAERPDARVLYIHGVQFVSDVVKSYQRKTFDALKRRYHSLDVLLIDDVQFIAGKERTQEEFFNAFEALLSRRAQIVMTSDTYPQGLTDIPERLASRFAWGLTVSIDPPELEMRVAILINKARAEGVELKEDVAFFVAKNVRFNVRELEGALRKLLAYARFNQKEISIPVAHEALRDLLSIQNRQISVENIQKTVADFYKIKVADMYSKKRPASIARPRQIAMYLAKEMTQKSLPEIGELFGGRDHTTVLHAVRKIGKERQQQAELNQQLHVLEQTLKC